MFDPGLIRYEDDKGRKRRVSDVPTIKRARSAGGRSSLSSSHSSHSRPPSQSTSDLIAGLTTVHEGEETRRYSAPQSSGISSIPVFRVESIDYMTLDYGQFDGLFTSYRFGVESHYMKWKIRKRYSDFEHFHSELIKYIRTRPEFEFSQDLLERLPALPPKTLRRCLDDEFVQERQGLLLEYLRQLLEIPELISTFIVMNFVGVISQFDQADISTNSMPYSEYVAHHADIGDIVLFQTKGLLSAAMRTVTLANYDHVGLVLRSPVNSRRYTDLKLLESTADGVRTYDLTYRLRQWNILCPRVVVRRLNVERNREFLAKVKAFSDKVVDMEYGIWMNILRPSDVPFEEQDNYFCSQLICAFYKQMGLVSDDVGTHRIWPGDLSQSSVNFPVINAELGEEVRLTFNLPAVRYAEKSLDS